MQLSYDQGKTGLNSEAVAQYNGNISIDYNYLNLPQQITFDSGDEIHYLYTAEGQKLQKRIVEQAGSTNKTDYFGGRIYESGQLKEIAHEEGRILATTTGFEYHYYLRDHLGNVRVEFKEDADGEAAITQENHYYPFGMRFSGEVFANNDNDFRYNGKELQDDFELDWYDYGARFYDPALGRWHAVDLLADKAPGWTPYRYGFNNPMSFIDPDGRAELQTIDAHLINEDEDSVWITQSVTDKKGRTIISRTVKKGEGETATGSDEGENSVFFMQAEGRIVWPIGELGFTTSIQAGIIFYTWMKYSCCLIVMASIKSTEMLFHKEAVFQIYALVIQVYEKWL